MKSWRVGCSGYHYPEWKNIFYPEGLAQRRWFEHYAQHFNTIELNTSFYRFPRVSFLQSWYEKSPADFCFSVKVPRAITHFKQFLGTERMLSDFYLTCRAGLAEKLGPVLFQLPSRLVYTEERLTRIISSIDPSFNNVVEFRHPTWWHEKVYFALNEKNISFCSISHPDLPDYVVADVPFVYYRFHGVPKLYQSQYKRDKVREIIDQVKDVPVEKAFIYFNNTMGIAGIRNAKYTQTLIKE